MVLLWSTLNATRYYWELGQCSWFMTIQLQRASMHKLRFETDFMIAP